RQMLVLADSHQSVSGARSRYASTTAPATTPSASWSTGTLSSARRVALDHVKAVQHAIEADGRSPAAPARSLMARRWADESHSGTLLHLRAQDDVAVRPVRGGYHSRSLQALLPSTVSE